jgi:hypothetical protein
MKIKVVFAVTIMLIASLSCSIVGSGPQATQSTQSISTIAAGAQSIATSASNVENAGSNPNLEIRAFLGQTTPGSSGMKTVAIMIDAKNASSGWYAYYLNTIGLNICAGAGNPTLLTKEGYSYNFSPDCAAGQCGLNALALQQLPLPPGAAFAWTNTSEYDSQYANWWGYLPFDIPENATPKEVTFTYGAAGEGNTKCNSVTTPVRSMDEYKPIADAIDLKYGLQVSKPGDVIELGKLARLTLQAGESQSDGTVPVTFTIASLDAGYPLQLSIQSYLLYHDGVFCCTDPMMGLQSRWQVLQQPSYGTWTIGPSQTESLQTSLKTRNGTVLMIATATVQESSPANNQSEQQRFVLQIP